MDNNFQVDTSKQVKKDFLKKNRNSFGYRIFAHRY